MNDLLRIVTCGSVDDGKSTLIGHLLYDAKLIFSDQEKALELESKVKANDGAIDYSLLLDGLSAEREQGITIDVSYRFFATERRRFIVADCPGHAEYTRNMAVGASTSDLAVLLIDASKGIKEQTKRHLRICGLMGIKDYLFAVNKMDLVDYDENVFLDIERAIEKTIAKTIKRPDGESNEGISHSQEEKQVQLIGTGCYYIIPVSALKGDNITKPSENMPWYQGSTFLEFLENVDTASSMEEGFVMQVQRVSHHGSYRGYQGQISCGEIKTGDTLTIYSGSNASQATSNLTSNIASSIASNVTSKVTSILVGGVEASSAKEGEAVSISIEDDIDISRGHVFAKGTSLSCTNLLEANILWVDDQKLFEGRSYIMKLASQTKLVSVMKIKHQIDIDTGKHISKRELSKNQLACVDISSSEPLVFDSFDRHKEMGRFILIDRITNATAACGTVCFPLRRGTNLTWQETDITRSLRANSLMQKPKTIWFTGLSGSGKSTIANRLEKELALMGMHTMLLDGDNVRLGINKDLGFNDYDRTENIRRVAEIAKLMNDAGLIVLTAFISPFDADREMARRIIGGGSYIEVYVSTPIEECEKRDVKGLYKKARSGEIPNFTGIDSPYEVPSNPMLEINAGEISVEEAVKSIIDVILPKLKA